MARLKNYLIAVLIFLIILFFIGMVAASGLFVKTVIESGPAASREQVDFNALSPVASLYPMAEYTNVQLRTEDGLMLQAFFHPSQNGAAVIVLHGYRHNHTQMFPIANMLVEQGYGVILPDLRGHGLSEGSEITFGKKEVLDAEAAYQFLLTQPGIDSQRIAIFGNSLGATISILYGARNPHIKAVVAQSPFASLHDIVWTNTKRTLPALTYVLAPLCELRLELRLGRNTDAYSPLKQVHSIAPRPVFIMMGGKDEMTDPQGGQRLYNAAGEPKTLWYEPSLNHLEFQEKQPEEFERRVIEFFLIALR